MSRDTLTLRMRDKLISSQVSGDPYQRGWSDGVMDAYIYLHGQVAVTILARMFARYITADQHTAQRAMRDVGADAPIVKSIGYALRFLVAYIGNDLGRQATVVAQAEHGAELVWGLAIVAREYARQRENVA